MNTAAAPAWLPTPLVPFVTLSYPAERPLNPDSFPDANYYGIGLQDGWLLVSSMIFFAIARDVSRLYILEPLARWKLKRDIRHGERLLPYEKGSSASSPAKANGTVANGNGHANGHPKEQGKVSRREMRELNRRVMRFAEQGWLFIYYTYQWSMGLYIYLNLPASITNLDPLWIGYPHILLAGPVKLYYITQSAFYTHLILVTQAEAHRKDHWQMMTHHIITVALVNLSYFYNFTRVGTMIMVIMDWCDIIFALAKMLRYTGFRTLCDIAFGAFLTSWAVTRHAFFGMVIWSTYKSPIIIPFDWRPEDGYWWSRQVWQGFVALLVSLQLIQVMWFTMICGVAIRVLTGQGAEDTRSDEEADNEAVEDKEE